MALINTPIYNSFIRLDTPSGYGGCAVPQICLPVLNPDDLAFQLKFLATGTDVNYLMQINGGSSFHASCNGTVLKVTALLNDSGYIYPNLPLAGSVSTGTVITGQVSGAPGGVGVYTVNQVNFFSGENLTIAGTNILGKIGALAVADGQAPPASLPFGQYDWVCTAAAPAGNTGNVNGLVADEWVLYFQPANSSPTVNWQEIPTGTCFNIYFYELQFMYDVASGAWNLSANALTPGALCTNTCFTKIAESCEGYPTSLLQYANNSDAFGFYYDPLSELVDNINFVNSVRLPLYLHSPMQAEDQMTYNLSNGAALKLSHRIWTDYKLKTDYLTSDQHRALVVATAHDLLFIECPAEGINLGGSSTFAYSFSNSQTQFVRTEKIEVEWQQENMPRFKLGQAKGTLRLAEAFSNTNSNCV